MSRKNFLLWVAISFLLALVPVLAAGHEEQIAGPKDNTNYIFLQKFPLQNTGGRLFHTEILSCPRLLFSKEDQKTLDYYSQIVMTVSKSYMEMEESWWANLTVPCVELGYGGASCSDTCCGVPHADPQTNFPLNARRAVISNADTLQKSLFLYGVGNFDGNRAFEYACSQNHTCWSHWKGTDYNPLTNNCNTFTSTILKCVYGLSEKKPHLGPSDMVTVKCNASECVIPSRSRISSDTQMD